MRYLTTKEAAIELKVAKCSIAECTIRRMIYRKQLRAVKIGGRWMIPEDEFERLLKEGNQPKND